MEMQKIVDAFTPELKAKHADFLARDTDLDQNNNMSNEEYKEYIALDQLRAAASAAQAVLDGNEHFEKLANNKYGYWIEMK